MQITTTIRYQLTAINKPEIKQIKTKQTEETSVGEHVKRKATSCNIGGNTNLPLWKTILKLLKTLKIGLPYDPVIALLGI